MRRKMVILRLFLALSMAAGMSPQLLAAASQGQSGKTGPPRAEPTQRQASLQDVPSVIAIPNYPAELWRHHVESLLQCSIAVSPAGAASLDQCTGSSIAATMDGPREIEAISNDFVEAIREAVALWRFPAGATRKLQWKFQFRLLPELKKDALTLPLTGPVLSEIHLPDRIIIRAKRKEIRRFH